MSSIQSLLDSGFHLTPLPGRCLILLDPLPHSINGIHIPDSARNLKITDIAHTGKVLAMTPGRHEKSGKRIEEWFKTGDRVLVMLQDKDREETVIGARNGQVIGLAE